MIAFLLCPSVPLVLPSSIKLLHYLDQRIVNIMKVYIETNNVHLELKRYREKCRLYSIATRRVQCNIARRLGTEIFTGIDSIKMR